MCVAVVALHPRESVYQVCLTVCWCYSFMAHVAMLILAVRQVSITSQLIYICRLTKRIDACHSVIKAALEYSSCAKETTK